MARHQEEGGGKKQKNAIERAEQTHQAQAKTRNEQEETKGCKVTSKE